MYCGNIVEFVSIHPLMSILLDTFFFGFIDMNIWILYVGTSECHFMTFDNCHLIVDEKLANTRDINSFNGSSMFSYESKHISSKVDPIL